MNSPKRSKKGLDMNMNVDLSKCDDVVCESCGNPTFRQVVMFKKLSAVYSPTGKATMIPLQVFECSECGHVNDEFIPKTGDRAGSNAVNNE